MKNIDYKQLKRYDIGKMPGMSSGYQQNSNVPNFSAYKSNPGYDMTNDIRQTNASAIGTGLSKAGQMASNLGSMFQGYTSTAAANAANVAAANAINTAGGTIAKQTIKEGGKALADAVTEGGGTAVKAGLSTAGKVAGAVGAAYGAYSVANDIMGYNNYLKGSDLQSMTSTNTQSKYGVNYTTYGGFNSGQAMDYTNAQNRSASVNTTMDAMGTGASIGGLVGSIWPGAGTAIGTAIGAGVGALSGWIGSWFGGKSRKQKVQDEINATQKAQEGYNTQQEAEAGSQGLRNQFYETHANKGKNPTFNNGKPGNIGIVHTADGVQLGRQFGLAGKGEIIYDPVKGKASEYKEGKVGVDNIATGTPLGEEGNWNPTVIFSKTHKYFNGESPADYVKPWLKFLNDTDNDNDMNLAKHTKEVNRKNALRIFNNAAIAQRQISNQEQGMFDGGKEFAQTLIPRFAQMANIFSTYGHVNPRAYNTYVSSGADEPIRGMYSLRYDPTQELNSVNRSYKESLNNIRNAGSLTAGQRSALMLQNSNKAAQLRNDIYGNAQSKNLALRQGAYQADAASRHQEQQEMMTGENFYRTQQAAANAVKYEDMLKGSQSFNNLLNTTASDYMAFKQYNDALAYQNKLIGLYGYQNKLNALKLRYMMNGGNTGNTTPVVTNGLSVDQNGNVYSGNRKVNFGIYDSDSI